MSFIAIKNVLKAYGLARAAYLEEHPQKRLFPTLQKYANVNLPKQPIIVPGPALEETMEKGRNLGLILLLGLVALAVLKD